MSVRVAGNTRQPIRSQAATLASNHPIQDQDVGSLQAEHFSDNCHITLDKCPMPTYIQSLAKATKSFICITKRHTIQATDTI